MVGLVDHPEYVIFYACHSQVAAQIQGNQDDSDEAPFDCVTGTMLRPKQSPLLHSWYCRPVNNLCNLRTCV